MAVKTEIKYHSGRIVETKKEERNGEPVGLISGFIATFDIDRGDFRGMRDQFVKGAFLKSIAEHKLRNNRQIRFKDHHGRTVGGFPIAGVFENKKGLFGTAEVNLNVQQGREVFALAKQGVLVDFSIGFIPIEKSTDEDLRLRTITEASIIEGSIVDEPMNPEAEITDVKSLNLDKIQHALEHDDNVSKKEAREIVALLNAVIEDKTVTPFLDLPLADRDRVWSAPEAIQRVRVFTDSEDEPSSTYRRAFLWFDGDDTDQFGAYKLPYADVINGVLTAIPSALNNASARLSQTDIPAADKPRVQRNIERYQDKLDEIEGVDQSSMDDEDQQSRDKPKSVVDVAEVKAVTDQKGIEKLLKKQGFSQNAATMLVKLAKEFKSGNQGDPGDGNNDDDQGDPEDSEVLNALNDLLNSCEEKQIIHKLNRITHKVNVNV